MSTKRAGQLQRREQRQRKKAERATFSRERAEASFYRLTAMIGIEDYFRDIPEQVRRRYVANSDRSFVVEVDPSLAGYRGLRTLVKDVEEALHVPREFCVEDKEFFACAYDYFRYYYDTKIGLEVFSGRLLREREPRLVAFGERTADALRRLLDWHERYRRGVVNNLVTRLDLVLNSEYRVDERTLSYDLLPPAQPSGKPRVSLRLTIPEKVSVYIDGKPRTAFLSGRGEGPGDVVFPKWRSSVLGLPGPDRPLPVVVQKHAIVRTRERLPRYWEELVAHNLIFNAIRGGKLHPCADGTWLVEVVLGEDRLGYLVAQPVGDRVVIRTFLFLTMQGTPEATLLREKMGIGRSSIEYHKLDQIATFLDSDIRFDPILTRLLEACGCGHLLHFGEMDPQAVWLPGHSAKLREDLGISEHNGGIRIGGVWRRLCADSAPAGAGSN